MNTSEYRIKVPGNSGCQVEIIKHEGKPAVQKTAKSLEYSVRLNKQMQKQDCFSSNIQALRIPRILAHDENSFTMEYLHMLDSIEFFELADPVTISRRLDALFGFIQEELAGSVPASIKSDLLLAKLADVERAIPSDVWGRHYRQFAKGLQSQLTSDIVVPLGPCHGDLTFSNIMFSMGSNNIGLIDFLDSFLETPIVDIVKLRQDTKFDWTNIRYKLPHDSLKIRIIMSWIDRTIDEIFGDLIQSTAFQVIEKLNYLRIAPYVSTELEHQYLSGILAKLIFKEG